jgi:tRNA(adenine34) deaminase
MSSDEQHMRLALEEAARARAEGNRPYGAVIVRGNVAVSGRNLVATTGDPTAHAEVVAIRHAADAWATSDLSGSTLYASFEPCPMCCGAIMLSGITSLVIGARPAADDPWLGEYSVERLLDLAGRREQFSIDSSVLAEDCRRFYAGA